MGVATVRSARRGALALAVVVALAGCTGAAATPQTIYLTLPPAAETPTPEPTPEPTPAPEPTSTPEPTPTPSPTSPAAACTGTPEHQAYFVKAASALEFDVYCAVLPSGWWLQSSGFDQRADYLGVAYKNNAGDFFVLAEGRLCENLSHCMDGGLSIEGPASFGGLAGSLRLVANPPAIYDIVVTPHSVPGYEALGGGISRAQLVQFTASLVRVPKP
jgi:hypothetical protein